MWPGTNLAVWLAIISFYGVICLYSNDVFFFKQIPVSIFISIFTVLKIYHTYIAQEILIILSMATYMDIYAEWGETLWQKLYHFYNNVIMGYTDVYKVQTFRSWCFIIQIKYNKVFVVEYIRICYCHYGKLIPNIRQLWTTREWRCYLYMDTVNHRKYAQSLLAIWRWSRFTFPSELPFA